MYKTGTAEDWLPKDAGFREIFGLEFSIALSRVATVGTPPLKKDGLGTFHLGTSDPHLQWPYIFM